MDRVRLSDILEYEQPSKYIVKSDQYKDDYKTPVLTAGKTFILGYTNESEGIYNASPENPIILFDDFTTECRYIDFAFKVKSSAVKILKPIGKVNLKYIYYVLKSIVYDTTSHKRYWISQYSNFLVTLPDAEFQKKVVEKMEKMENLISIKEKELLKLEQLIKSQYVEMFNNCDCLEKTLEEITIKITDGSHNPPTGVSENTGYLMLSSQNVINKKINYENVRYLKKEDFEKENKRTNLQKGDVLLTIVGTVGRTAVIDGEKNIVLQRSVAVIKPNKEINSIYLMNALNSDDVVNQLNNGAKGVAQKGIYLNDLKKIIVKVPQIEKQKQFVEFVKLIDKQKSICNKEIKRINELIETQKLKYFGGVISE